MAADLDADIRIVLPPASGAVTDGVGANLARRTSSRSRRRASLQDYGTLSDPTASSRFDLIAAGDYVATFNRVIAPPVAFHVAIGTTTSITLAPPATQVGLDIELAGADCTGVRVTAIAPDDGSGRNGAWLALAACDNPHHASLDGFAPGTYNVCNNGDAECTIAEIAPTPARQQ